MKRQRIYVLQDSNKGNVMNLELTEYEIKFYLDNIDSLKMDAKRYDAFMKRLSGIDIDTVIMDPVLKDKVRNLLTANVAQPVEQNTDNRQV